jgi:5-methylcytosine-specific restriction endonuclease McrA
MATASRRRCATKRQRLDAFLRSNGRCALCDVTLTEGFHVDHVIPFSKQGETEKWNLQATCPACNLRRGASS